MSVRDIMVVATVILYTASAIDYVRLTWQRRINPVPATWILMLITISLSTWMYMQSPNHSFAGNIGNTAALLNLSMIFAGVAARHFRDRTWQVAFNRLQKSCLLLGALIVVFWWFYRDGWVSYILTQTLALVAYPPTVVRLWKAERTTEPVFVWLAVLLACLTALYPAIVMQDKLAWIYLARAIPSTTIVLLLIFRLKRREKLALQQA